MTCPARCDDGLITWPNDTTYGLTPDEVQAALMDGSLPFCPACHGWPDNPEHPWNQGATP